MVFNNIQGVCINAYSKYHVCACYVDLIFDVCNIHQLLCWFCNALKQLTARDVLC